MEHRKEHLTAGLWSMRVAKAERAARKEARNGSDALQAHISKLDAVGVLQLVEDTRMVVSHVRNGLSAHTDIPYDVYAGAEGGAPQSYVDFVRAGRANPDKMVVDAQARDYPAFFADAKPPEADASHEAMYDTLSGLTAKQFALNRLGERMADDVMQHGGRGISPADMTELVRSISQARSLRDLTDQPDLKATMDREGLSEHLQRAADGIAPAVQSFVTGAPSPPLAPRHAPRPPGP